MDTRIGTGIVEADCGCELGIWDTCSPAISILITVKSVEEMKRREQVKICRDIGDISRFLISIYPKYFLLAA